jgi:outer membrane protein assembly factor BamB
MMHSIVLFCSVLLAADAPPTADAWPGFLGGGQVSVPADSLPLKWSPTENIAWQVPLPGHGQSSPVVIDGKVFVTAVEGPMKDTYHVLAYSLPRGKQLWKHSLESTDKVKNSFYVSRAAPTPVADERGVYAFFESGDVVALSLAGKPLWNRSLAGDYGKFKSEFGLGASPVQTEEAVIILADNAGPSYLIALSKADGKTLWKTERTPRQSWSSPAIVSVSGQPQVVCSSAGSVDGYDPATGKLLWSFDEVAGNTSATPLPFADGKFLVGASVGREGADRAAGAKKSNMAAAIETVDGKPALKVLWRTEEATPTFGSPIVYAENAYWVNRSGVVYCFNAKTGEPNYTERTKQSVWATPLGVGDRLYLFGKDGLTTVLRTGPKFEVLAENELWDPKSIKPDTAKAAAEETAERRRSAATFAGRVQYGIAVAHGSLLIRTGDVLYCVRQE